MVVTLGESQPSVGHPIVPIETRLRHQIYDDLEPAVGQTVEDGWLEVRTGEPPAQVLVALSALHYSPRVSGIKVLINVYVLI